MSGKPAARQGDMTQYGGPIVVQGSAGRELARQPAWPVQYVPAESLPATR